MSDRPIAFDEDHAKSYETRFAKLEPMKKALHLVARLALEGLPEQARILCVGAGTGAEILALGEAFPSWQFVAVEPAAPMLARCRERAEAAGMTDRCTFHEGYLDSLDDRGFDAATSILVSQFVLDRDERRKFFAGIADRLQPGAPLVTADLAHGSDALVALWRKAWLFADMPPDKVDAMCAALGKNVSVLPPADIESLIEEAGFHPPLRCFQSVLIHAWIARRRD